MELDKNKEPEKKKENVQGKTEKWIDKTEEFIEDKAEKLHKSDAYQKADKSLEETTKNIFRKAGLLWGKSERYLKSGDKKKDNH